MLIDNDINQHYGLAKQTNVRLGICRKRGDYVSVYVFGKYCCTFIPNNTAPDGSFTVAKEKLEELRGEVHENAGKGGLSWDGLDQILGKLGAVLAKAAISAVLVLIVTFLLICCILPMLRRQCQQKIMKEVMGLKKAHVLHMSTLEQQAQILLAHLEIGLGEPDLFPVPSCRENDSEEE